MIRRRSGREISHSPEEEEERGGVGVRLGGEGERRRRRMITKITTDINTAKQIIIIFPLCYLQLLLFVDCIALYVESNPQ